MFWPTSNTMLPREPNKNFTRDANLNMELGTKKSRAWMKNNALIHKLELGIILTDIISAASNSVDFETQ